MALIGTFAILIRFAYIKPSKEFQIYKVILLVLALITVILFSIVDIFGSIMWVGFTIVSK